MSNNLHTRLQFPERPECLKSFFEVADTVSEGEIDLYRSFLIAAEKAQRELFSVQSHCAIKMFHKLEHNNTVITRKEGNSSLRSIYFFYAKLLVGGASTFDDVDISNITISFYELCSVLRDFQVIPVLISKEDVQFLWKVSSLESVKSGESSITELDFDQFRHFVGRCAILAYNRPGMRRLILNTHGTMPSQTELVEMIARHMHLDDYALIKEKINTTGMSRVKSLNSRGRGEVNEELKKELREDLNARRLAREQMKKTEIKDENNSEANRISDALRKKLTGLDTSHKEFPPSVNPSSLKGSRFQSTRALSEIQGTELLMYDPRTTSVFDKYCLNPINQSSSAGNDGFQVCDGAFIDLGELIPGRRCVINLQVRNNTSHEMQLDVVARGFPGRDIQITTLPCSFAPGMNRNVSVSFTVHRLMYDVIGFIDVVLVPVRIEPAVSISCPVYYRISESLSSRKLNSFPVCTLRNLPELLRKYCSRVIAPKVTFEKNKSWYRGPKWANGPNCSLTDGGAVIVPGCYRGLRTHSASLKLTRTSNSSTMDLSQPILR